MWYLNWSVVIIFCSPSSTKDETWRTSDMRNSNFFDMLFSWLHFLEVVLNYLGKARWRKIRASSTQSFLQGFCCSYFNRWLKSVIFLFICAVSSELQETLCLRSRHSVPGIVPAFCLLLRRLNFVKLAAEHSLIMLLNLIFPDDCLASPLGVKIWLECGSLLWSAHWGRACLAAGEYIHSGQWAVIPVCRCQRWGRSTVNVWVDVNVRQLCLCLHTQGMSRVYLF